MERRFNARRHIMSNNVNREEYNDKKVKKSEKEGKKDEKTASKTTVEGSNLIVEKNSDINKETLDKLLCEIGQCLTDFRKPKNKKKYNYKKQSLYGGSIKVL